MDQKNVELFSLKIATGIFYEAFETGLCNGMIEELKML